MEKKRILLVDDEQALCKLTKLNLERTGEFQVTTAYSGEEALGMAKGQDFDLVITDYRMPGMDGKELLEALKALRPNRPVVLFSIYHDDCKTITADLEAKADGLISKPIDHEKLVQTIQEALAGSRSRKGRG